MSTDATTFFQDLDGGTFAAKVGISITNAGRGAINFRKKGKVVIELEFEQIGDSRQVNIAHTLKVVEPTERGEIAEKQTTETPMFVHMDGNVTAFPPEVPTRQIDAFKGAGRAEEDR